MRKKLGAAALLGAGGLLAVSLTVGVDGVREEMRDAIPFLRPSEQCTATVDGRKVTLSPEQAENAALITAISVRRGLPARAASIALATAYQESKLVNIDYGDRDSRGLFQQRPSQGWGTPRQVTDPVYATNAFYDGLTKVRGYESMEVTEAAQAVQRSAYPDAYADHEADARVLASALTGNSREAFTCTVDLDVSEASDKLTATGLVPRAQNLREDIEGVFGPQSLGGFAPGGVRDGHMRGSAHYDGRAIDIFFRPISEANKVKGWALAHYLVAHAERLGIETVIFDDRIWQASDSEDGWEDYRPQSSAGDRAILEHRDHVHVDVAD